MGRWIKVYDKLLDWEWWDSALMVKAWIYILVSANPKKKRWQGIEIERGKFITSQRKLARALSCNVKTVRRILERLSVANQITYSVEHRMTCITVCNYDDYQEKNSRYGTEHGTQDGTDYGTQDGTEYGTQGGTERGHNIRIKNKDNIVVDVIPAGVRAREDFSDGTPMVNTADRPTGLGFCARARIPAEKVANWLRENGGDQWKEIACMQLGLQPQQLDLAFDEFQRELIAQGVEDKEEDNIRIHFMNLIRKKIEWNKKQNRYGNDQRINSIDDVREAVELGFKMANSGH